MIPLCPLTLRATTDSPYFMPVLVSCSTHILSSLLSGRTISGVTLPMSLTSEIMLPLLMPILLTRINKVIGTEQYPSMEGPTLLLDDCLQEFQR